MGQGLRISAELLAALNRQPRALNFSETMTSFFSRFRAALVAFTAFVTLVNADHDLNMQCVAKFRPVAIDTDDANGGIARTSFLYVEVEADQKSPSSPGYARRGTSLPRKHTRFNTPPVLITTGAARSRGATMRRSLATYPMNHPPTMISWTIPLRIPA